MIRSTRRRGGLLPALALLLAVALTGCGSDDGGDDLSAAATGAADSDSNDGGSDDGGDGGGDGGDRSDVDPEQAELDFYECMREHGVDLPDPDPGQPGMQLRLPQGDPNAQAAAEECRHLLPNGGEPPELDASQLESLRAFTSCMRDNGIDMPDPGADGTLSMPQGIDPESAQFQTAMSTCQPLLEGAPIRMRAGGGGQ